MNLRRIILILGFFLFIIAAAIAIYYVFFKRGVTPPVTNVANTNQGGLPSTNVNVNRPVININGTLIPVNATANRNISVQNVNGSTIAEGGPTKVNQIATNQGLTMQVNPQSGKLYYYDPVDGKFKETSPDGKTVKELSTQIFPDAKEIVWAKNGDKAAITFPDNSKIIYDFLNKKQYSLPKEAENFSFSPTGEDIAYKYLPPNEEDRWIVTSKVDGSGVKFVETIGNEAPNVEVNWSPKSDIVATFRKAIDADRQEVFFVGQNKENFKSLITDGRGFSGKWSTTGEQLMYSIYSPDSSYNPRLFIVNGSGDALGTGRTDLGLATWPDKCTFSSTAVAYCAVPRFLPPGSGLRSSIETRSDDDLYKINILTGEKELIAMPTSSVNARDLYLSSDGSQLFFTNSLNGTIQSIRLK